MYGPYPFVAYISHSVRKAMLRIPCPCISFPPTVSCKPTDRLRLLHVCESRATTGHLIFVIPCQ